jgi:hypothetical protein
MCISSIKLKDSPFFLIYCFGGDFYILGSVLVSTDENLCSLTDCEWLIFAVFCCDCCGCCGCCERLLSQLTLDALTMILSLKVGSLAWESGRSSHAMLFS